MGHCVKTLESYWAPPFWIITRSRENVGLPFWIITRTHDLIYILMKWLPIDLLDCNIEMSFFFKRLTWNSNPGPLVPPSQRKTMSKISHFRQVFGFLPPQNRILPPGFPPHKIWCHHWGKVCLSLAQQQIYLSQGSTTFFSVPPPWPNYLQLHNHDDCKMK